MKLNRTIKRALHELNVGGQLDARRTPNGERVFVVEAGRAIAHVPLRQARRMVAAGLVGEQGRISPLGRAALLALALHLIVVLTAFADGALDLIVFLGLT